MLSKFHKHFLIIQYFLHNWLLKGPTHADIELTNRCNLRCRMCWFHGEKGVGDKYRNSQMTTAEIKELINQLSPYRPRLYFGGGEPFMREDFLDILAHAKSYSFPISFTTNGTLLDEKKAEKINELEVDSINVSIDGPEDLHDQVRGHGNFKKATSNIRQLLHRRNSAKPVITINTTINPLVIDRLSETIDTVRETTGDKVDLFRIHHLWFITPTQLQAHKAEVQRTLRCSALGAESHCIPPLPPDMLNRLSREMSRLKNNEKVIFFPNLQGQEVNDYYSEGYRLTKRCMAPFQALLIKPNGDLKFCPDEWIDDYVLGNLRTDRLETIWRNGNARFFRSVLLRRKSFPACRRCSWMHCF